MANLTDQQKNDRANGKDKNVMPGAFTDQGGAGGALDQAKDTANTLLSQAKTTAGDAYNTVAEKATTTIEEKKAGFTGSLTSVADSIRQVGDNLGNTADQNSVTQYSSQYARTAADKLESAARYFEARDLRAIARDAEDYARRNPAVFIGTAFALGVLAARFFKSSPTPSIGQGAITPDHQLAAGAMAAGSESRPRSETF